tara:strand:+ start:8494 stop:8607 length:114 start_codon:yes stop_codon:yes gene_type:complete
MVAGLGVALQAGEEAPHALKLLGLLNHYALQMSVILV